MQTFIPLIARIFLSLIFLSSLAGKLGNFQGTAAYMQKMGMTFATEFFLFGAIVLLAAGGLSVLLGYRAKIGAVLLLVFLIPATLIFHTDFADRIQMIMFMKNLAIMGGLLMITAYGSGPFSLDRRQG
jgi:putative oxidoreductase